MAKIFIFFIFTIASFASGLKFDSLQSEFIQIVNSQDKIIKYEGKFYAKNDNSALWIYESPTLKKIYFNNKQVVIIEDELEQAIISKLDDTPNLSQILARAEEIEPELYKANYDGVDYLITIKNELAVNINYNDKLGNKIEITLKNPVKNAEISKEILTPTIPQGYDIINQ